MYKRAQASVKIRRAHAPYIHLIRPELEYNVIVMKDKFKYQAGDTVRIKSGPFALFTARIVEVNQERATLKVTIKFQNEWRILKLRFLDVEKAPAI